MTDWADERALAMLEARPWYDKGLLAPIAAALRAAERRGLERAKKAVSKLYGGGPAHTYASENADLYRAQDRTRAEAMAAIQSLIDKPETEETR